MNKKVSNIISNLKSPYAWKYCSVGGVTRINILSGEDIRHLHELDQKLWTVLSCPTFGLEFDRRTLELLDTDGDQRIRVNEVTAVSQWLCKVISNPDMLLKGEDFIALSNFNVDNEEGKQLHDYATNILNKLGKDTETISLADVLEYKKVYEDKCRAAHAEMVKNEEPYALPYGDNTETVLAAANELREKVADFFMRCKLIQFDSDCSAVLDVSVDKVGAISTNNLSACASEIATYPLARPNATALLPLQGGINPAWHGAFNTLKQFVFDVDYAGKEGLDESQWNEILAKLDAYVAWKADRESKDAECLSGDLAGESATISPVEKLLYFYRDFYRLLCNYVVMKDFYSPVKDRKAIFQAGKLYIDQRCCDLCIRVSDPVKHTTMAGLSGMYLIYCTCTSRLKGDKIDIVAVLTDGDVDDLCVGKNAIFYDCNGLDYDAVVTKIIDNPISIRQAFLSPYKKFWKWCTDKINKSAAEKESKSFENLTAKANTATTDLAASVQTPADPSVQTQPADKKAPFDIAKFAGIFAAIGMAVGYITSALVNLVKGVTQEWYSLPLFLCAIVLVISGPSMFIAWSKLRKRNLGPVLNANGWAINSQIVVNTRFGATLTSIARYPALMLEDPFAEKDTPKWKIWLVSIVTVLVVAFAVLFFRGKLACIGLPFPKPVAEVVEEAPCADSVAPADSVVAPAPEAAAPAQ